MLGAQCAALPELFGSRHRYIGVAVAREFSAIIAGGIAPFVGALLLGWFANSWIPLAVYVIVLTVIFGRDLSLLFIAIGAVSWLDMSFHTRANSGLSTATALLTSNSLQSRDRLLR